MRIQSMELSPPQLGYNPEQVPPRDLLWPWPPQEPSIKLTIQRRLPLVISDRATLPDRQ